MKFVLLILGPPVVAILVGYVTHSWIWGIVSFPIAMFVFNRIAVWLFGHPSKEEVRRMAERPVKDDFSKEELEKEVVQIKSKFKPQKEMKIESEEKGLIPADDRQAALLEKLNNISQMNHIEEYDVELRKDIIRLEEMYAVDRDFDRKEAEVFFERRLSKEEADELIGEKVIGPAGHGVLVKKDSTGKRRRPNT